MNRCTTGTATIIFPKSLFTRREAVAWARKHGYRTAKVDTTPDSYRIRQFAPAQIGRARSKKLANGAVLVLSFCD